MIVVQEKQQSDDAHRTRSLPFHAHSHLCIAHATFDFTRRRLGISTTPPAMTLRATAHAHSYQEHTYARLAWHQYRPPRSR